MTSNTFATREPASRRVLVASSDGFQLAEFQVALQSEGIESAIARDGIECLERIHDFFPDLIVLDTDLLWGGAEGVLAVLANDHAYPAIPAMIVSSRRSRAALYQVGRFIISDYQLKPLTGEHLVRRIRFLFESDSRRAGAGRLLEFANLPGT